MDSNHIDVVGDQDTTGSTSATASGTTAIDSSKYSAKSKIFSPAREISLQNDMKLNADRLYCPYSKPTESKTSGSNNDLFRYLQPYFPAEILNGVYQSAKVNQELAGMNCAESDESTSGKNIDVSSMQGAVAARPSPSQAATREAGYESATSENEKKSAAIGARGDDDKLTFSTGFSCDKLANTMKMVSDDVSSSPGVCRDGRGHGGAQAGNGK